MREPISALVAPLAVNRFVRKSAGNLRFFRPIERTENVFRREIGGGREAGIEQSLCAGRPAGGMDERAIRRRSICAKMDDGRFLLMRHTMRKRMKAKLVEIKETLNRMLHVPVPEQGRWLGQEVRGYLAYHAVPTPSIASMSSSLGMATISFDLSATLTCPNTSRRCAANAVTMWLAVPVFYPCPSGATSCHRSQWHRAKGRR